MEDNNSAYQKIKLKPVQLRPFVYKKPSLTEVSVKILILLGLQLIALALTKSWNALLVVFASVSGAELAAIIHYLIKKEQGFSTITVAIQGIMIGMLLPETFPIITVFFLSFFVMFVSKFVFLNCINSWVNIVCIAVVIAWFIGRKYFPDFLITSDMFTLKNPCLSLIQNGKFPIYDFDASVTGYLNSMLFSHIKVTLPEGIISLLWDSYSIVPAFRFNLLTIIASIVLFSDNSMSLMIPSIFIFVYALLIRLFFPLISGGVFNTGDVILAICTSGTLFCSIFLLQWFGTYPMTLTGKIIFAVLAGILAFVIVGCGTSPVGMVYTVLFCNIINLIIRLIEERYNDKLIKRLVAAKSKEI